MTTLTPNQVRQRQEIVLPKRAYVFIGPLMLWALYHIYSTRSLSDVLRYSLQNGVLLWFVCVLLIGLAWYSAKPRSPVSGRDVILFLVVSAGFIVCFGAAFYIFGASIVDTAAWILEGLAELNGPISWRNSRTIAVAMSFPLAVGAALFWFKTNTLMLYGATEIMIGVAVFLSDLYTKKPDASLWSPTFALAILTASVYLVVQGLDNVHEGWKKRGQDVAYQLVMWLIK